MSPNCPFSSTTQVTCRGWPWRDDSDFMVHGGGLARRRLAGREDARGDDSHVDTGPLGYVPSVTPLCPRKPLTARAFSLLVYTEQPFPTRLFLKKSRTSRRLTVRSRSENALVGYFSSVPLPPGVFICCNRYAVTAFPSPKQRNWAHHRVLHAAIRQVRGRRLF